MTTATVTGPLLDDLGTPLAGRPVHAKLVGGSHTSTGELVQPVSVITNSSGQFSLALQLNTEITPAGSHWEVTTPGSPPWTIALVAAGSYHVGDPAIQTTGAAPGAQGATTAYVDAAIAAAVAAIPAPAPGVTAIPGFIDLAGQTRIMFRATSAGTSQNPIVATQPGRIVGLSVVATAARTAGSAVFTALVNGADADAIATIDASKTNYAHVLGTTAFVAGDRLAVRHADSGFTPSTNFEAVLWVAYG